MTEVSDLVLVISPPVDDGTIVDECNFVIHGRAAVQNGWKCVLHNRHRPVIYDPKRNEKIALRVALKVAFKELDRHTSFPIFQATKLVMCVTFNLVQSAGRDIDNMVKFLNDALEGVIFDNDKYVYEIHHARKQEVAHGNETTVVKVARVETL